MASFKDAACHHCGNADLDIIQNTENKKFYVECIDCEARGPEGKNKTEALTLWRKDDKAKVKAPRTVGDPQAALDEMYVRLNTRISERRRQRAEARTDGDRRAYDNYLNQLYFDVEILIDCANNHGVQINA